MTDTGPPYPQSFPLSGVDELFVGVKGIGDLPRFNWRDTILSQYANSPAITAIIESFNDAADQSANLRSFFDNIWNLDTAQGYGLDVWGRIVGINRVLKIDLTKWFGFSEAGSASADPFNQSPFYSGQPTTSNYSLVDQAYRQLIIAKAMANISDGSIPSINALLMYLFPGRGNCYVADGSAGEFFGFSEAPGAFGFDQRPFYSGQPLPRMVMRYVFTFPLTPLDYAIINSGVLPKPVGVTASVVVI